MFAHRVNRLSRFSLYHKTIIISSEIFGDAECEIIYSVNYEILLRCRNVKWNKSPTRPQAYFTWRSHISRPKGISQIPQGIYFVEKSTCFGLLLIRKFTVGATIGRPQTTAKPKRATNGRPYKQISAENLFSLPICVIMRLAKSLSPRGNVVNLRKI